MSILNGKAFRVYVGTVPALIGQTSSDNLDRGMGTSTVNNKDSDWDIHLPNKLNWQVSSNHFYQASSSGYAALEAAHYARETINVEFRDTETREKFSGTAYITALPISGGDGEGAQSNITLLGTGPLSARTTY